MNANSQLTIYKASAGSGKTFTLAKEYMTLVIRDPMAYRNILAVTFTNKATEEMKTRILSKLYGISRRLPDADDYLKEIKKSFGEKIENGKVIEKSSISEDQIVENAGIALSNLIHNYNYFRVETIDTFFQSVLRNLARELDLTANLRIGLNDTQVEQQAVDELIEELKVTDKLLFWIMDYIKENMEEDKAWNVIGQIKNFGTNIFKDYYKEQSDRLNECLEKEGFFESFAAQMKKKQKEAKDYFDHVAATFFDSLEENGLNADDFKNKTKGIWSYFNKLRNGKYNDEDLVNKTLVSCKEDAKNWFSGSNARPGNPAYDLVCDFLLDFLNKAEQSRPKVLRVFKSTELTLRHLNQLRLLGSIDHKVRELNKEANRFLLSDTQTLLHSLIQDSDSPFIFEKIGTQLEHVMIDEFQDTSTVQWKNFKVLLQETMSHRNPANLIVGDVKQSIYRWRSGDWRLLNNIENEFPGQRLESVPLSVNFRSNRNIILFNNAFFKEASKQEYEELLSAMMLPSGADKPQNAFLKGDEVQQLKKAYDDVEQLVPNSKGAKGYLRIQLVTTDEEEGDEEKMMRMTLDTIEELHAEGVAYDKMAILVRSNKIIQKVADYLMNNSDPKLPLVSDEAFRLDASQAVNILVDSLSYIAHPENQITLAAIKKFVETYPQCKEAYEELISHRDQLLQEPLLDLAEHLYCLFHLSEIEEMVQQGAYVCAFFDQLGGYLSDNGSDIENFLNEWDSNIRSKSIHCDKADGVRLISIHKSKGLEFDNVIMPFCDWKLEQGGTIWCNPKEKPYCELPLVPVDFSAKNMKGSVYEDDYHHEHLQNIVDNLNLLYVAFTRAGKNLFVYGRQGKANMRSNLIANCLQKVNEELQKTQENCVYSCDGDIIFEYGKLDTGKHKQEKIVTENEKLNRNVFLSQSENLPIVIKTQPKLHEFQPSKLSEEFIYGDDTDEQQKYYVKLGTVLHALFSTIKNKNDVEKALTQLELDGVIYDENVSKDRIKDMLQKRLNSNLVKDWFSDRWKVFNECNILYFDEDGKMQTDRPDRVLVGEEEIVVIDFKFGKQKEEHHQQVRRYMNQMQGMNPQKIVKGFLWYVYPNKVVEVANPS